MPDWTPEQLQKLMTYGACPECGAPRESRMFVDGELVEKGTSVSPESGREFAMGMVCENGHRPG
jgi:hypothetical protein